MDWIRDHAWESWLIAGILLGALELASGELILIMLAAGALVGMAVALAGGPFVLQMLIGIAVAVGLIALLRPPLVHRLHAGPTLKIGAEALIGKRALVLEPVSLVVPGRVKIGGEVWSAKPYDEDDEIEEGASVEVISIKGGIARVLRVQPSESDETPQPEA